MGISTDDSASHGLEPPKTPPGEENSERPSGFKGRLRRLGPGYLLRAVLGVILIVGGVAGLVLPAAPGLLMIVAGLVLLGFSVRSVLMLAAKVVPGFSREKAEEIANKEWVRKIDRWTGAMREKSA